MGYEARANKNGNRAVVLDFDDLADGNDCLDLLRKLRARDPGVKVTLFAIPTRLSDKLLARYEAERKWIQLAIHGWRHARHECLAWTSEETVEKLAATHAIYPHFVPVFKAPNWEICDEVYAGCQEAGIAVADHIRNLEILPVSLPHYIYNLRLRNDPYVRLHGHLQDWNNTGLSEVFETWSSPPVGTPYLFISEITRPGPVVVKQ